MKSKKAKTKHFSAFSWLVRTVVFAAVMFAVQWAVDNVILTNISLNAMRNGYSRELGTVLSMCANAFPFFLIFIAGMILCGPASGLAVVAALEAARVIPYALDSSVTLQDVNRYALLGFAVLLFIWALSERFKWFGKDRKFARICTLVIGLVLMYAAQYICEDVVWYYAFKDSGGSGALTMLGDYIIQHLLYYILPSVISGFIGGTTGILVASRFGKGKP